MRFEKKDKKIELVTELMKHRQVNFLKSEYGEFYYICHGVQCKKCKLKYFCEKHFSCNAPTIHQEQYEHLRELKPELFI